MGKIILFFFISFISYGQSNDDGMKLFNERQKEVKESLSEKVIKINEKFYMIQPFGGVAGNIGVFISNDGIILIDDQWEVIEELILETVNSISQKEIKFIINTHFHHDHIDGNKAFGKKGIPIISHKNVRKRLIHKKKLYQINGEEIVQDKYPKEGLPTVTYSSSMSLYCGDEEIQLHNFGFGHTDGDTLVFFKDSNIMHTGDSFVTYGYPYVDLNNGGSFKGFLNMLNQIIVLADNNTIIMPGHGPLSSLNDVQQLKNVIEEHYEITVNGYKNGLSIDEILKEITSELQSGAGITKKDFIENIIYDLKTN
jgi:glyoxylase-like metal-dependent hydrolase (beta-lactamase superfamily II)